ncbi:MAG: Type secretion system protein [Proteobacteria bacterium]|nr:Type secretion system protein [Pseudomonadota bacterium]
MHFAPRVPAPLRGQFRLPWSTYLPGRQLVRRLPGQDLLPGLAGFGLFLLIGGGLWLNIELLWSLRAQEHAPPPMLPSDPLLSAAGISQRHLFGLPSAAPSRQAAPLEFQLLGVLAAPRSAQGAAILLATGEKRPLIAHVGDEIAPGLRLTGLGARQATLSRDGRPFTLELPGPAASSAAPLPSPPHKPVFD